MNLQDKPLLLEAVFFSSQPNNFIHKAGRKNQITFDETFTTLSDPSSRGFKKNIRSIAVFCGSKPGNDPSFLEDAKKLGSLLAKHQIEIVYGGGSKGVMGAIADAALNEKGKVTGIIPQLLLEWEQQHTGLSELIVVPDMHTRKRMMYEKCETALILPGGFGTLDELFEMLTWNNLKIHQKPICLLNTHGFYDHLMQHIRHMEKEGFLYEISEKRLHLVNRPDDLFAKDGFFL